MCYISFHFQQKLIKRTVFAEHTAMIVERQEALLTQLKKDADEGSTRAEEEWERTVVAWGECLLFLFHSRTYSLQTNAKRKPKPTLLSPSLVEELQVVEPRGLQMHLPGTLVHLMNLNTYIIMMTRTSLCRMRPRRVVRMESRKIRTVKMGRKGWNSGGPLARETA